MNEIMSSPRLKRVLQDSGTPLHQRDVEADQELREANASLSAEIAKLRLRILELEQAANTDPLIPIYNRRAFIREVARAQSVMDRYDLPSTLIFFDLDNFKMVNDKYGHRVGDTLLTKIGTVLKSAIRQCDMVARLGGDEFGVLLFKTDMELAKVKAAALSCRIAGQNIPDPEGKISVSASWGVAPCEPGVVVEQILDRADRAMYMAKQMAS